MVAVAEEESIDQAPVDVAASGEKGLGANFSETTLSRLIGSGPAPPR
jgi:hypothetical protein